MTEQTEHVQQTNNQKKPSPTILISTLVIAFFAVAVEFTITNVLPSGPESAFYDTFRWPVYLSSAVITQFLLAIYLKGSGQYNLKPFVIASILLAGFAAIVCASSILQTVAVHAGNQALFDFASILVDLIRPWQLVYFLPLVVLASGFLVHYHYKLMAYVSAVVLVIVWYPIFFKIIRYSSIFDSVADVVRPLNDLIEFNYYLYYIGIILFVIGLLVDRGKAYLKTSTLVDSYDYDHDKEPSVVMYFSFSGRIERGRFWGVSIAISLALFVLSFLLVSQGIPALLYLISLLILSYIQLCLNSKRLHDQSISGWYQLIGLIPVVGQAILLWRFFRLGDQADNIYGRLGA